MKNAQIKTHNTTVTVKDYLLELYSMKIYKKSYKEQKKEVNKFIRHLVSKDATDSKNVSGQITMILTKIVAEE